MSNNVLTEYRPEIGTLLLILFGLASFIGILGASTGNHLEGGLSIFRDIVATFGNWVYWLAVIGPVGFAVVIWWVLDYVFKVRKLKNLIDTASKSKFIKNLDDIDYIAWRLPKKYKIVVAEKKKELRVTQ